MFIERSLDYNNNYEWIDYISEKEEYYYNNRENDDKKDNKLNQIQIFKLFDKAKKLNEKLFSNDIDNININIDFKSETNNLSSDRIEFFADVILKNIIKFAETLTGINYIIQNSNGNSSGRGRRFGRNEYYVEINDSLKNRLKEIYDTENITLLTFYEFVWFEEHYEICDGFLSSLKNHILYNFRMRDNIKKIKDINKPKIKRINHKDKKIKKNSDDRIYNSKKNKKINFKQIKLGLWKTRMPTKTRRKNNFDNNYIYKY